MEKKPCPKCVKLKKRLEDAEEREELLAEGIDYLLEEVRKLSGKKLELNPRPRKT